MVRRTVIRQEIGRADVPVRIARRIVQIQVIRAAIRAIVASASHKRAKEPNTPDIAPYIPIFNFLCGDRLMAVHLRRRSPSAPLPRRYAAIGCSKKTDAPMYQYALPAELAKYKQSAPQFAPPLHLPPTSAIIGVAVSFHQK